MSSENVSASRSPGLATSVLERRRLRDGPAYEDPALQSTRGLGAEGSTEDWGHGLREVGRPGVGQGSGPLTGGSGTW